MNIFAKVLARAGHKMWLGNSAVISVLAIGVTIAYAEQLQSTSIVFPLMEARVSSKYGPRRHPIRKVVRHHSGIDLAAPKNSHVRTVAAGMVVFADSYSGYGKLVTIKHPDGYTSLYGHLAEILANPGTQVDAGELIGRVGSTGLASGPHLHFEWRKDGRSIDPLKVFPSLTEAAEG